MMITNMTVDTTVDLLALCAVFDSRTVAREDVGGWLMIAQAEGWDAAAARRVVIDHYRRGADRPRITPAAISDRLRTIRSAAADTFEDPIIPESLVGQTYPEWYRSQRDAHVAAAVAAWADTGAEPRRGAIEGNVAGSLTELAAMAPDHVRAEMLAAADRLTNGPRP